MTEMLLESINYLHETLSLDFADDAAVVAAALPASFATEAEPLAPLFSFFPLHLSHLVRLAFKID